MLGKNNAQYSLRLERAFYWIFNFQSWGRCTLQAVNIASCFSNKVNAYRNLIEYALRGLEFSLIFSLNWLRFDNISW